MDWTTLTETNNYGFEVQKSLDSTAHFVMVPNSFISGHGTTLEPHQYTFVDSSASTGRWWYRLKQIDLDGTVHFADPIAVNIVTDVEENPLPTEFALYQNYPNPFNPVTTISYKLPTQSHVTLKVFDILGREVATLVNEVKQPGPYTVQFDARGLAGGVYMCQLSSVGHSQGRRMLLVK